MRFVTQEFSQAVQSGSGSMLVLVLYITFILGIIIAGVRRFTCSED